MYNFSRKEILNLREAIIIINKEGKYFLVKNFRYSCFKEKKVLILQCFIKYLILNKLAITCE